MAGERVVLMPALPGRRIQWGHRPSAGLSYVPYGVATWRWWCERNNAAFILLDTPPAVENVDTLPPTIVRWIAAASILSGSVGDVELAVVDADTMIRWDAPDLFAAAGRELSAVRDNATGWVRSSVAAYQHLFPNTTLLPEEYFNAGLLVFTRHHLPILQRFVTFWSDHAEELRRVQMSGDFGSDQTPLNFLVRQLGIKVRFLEPQFNFIHCVPGDLAWRVEKLAHAGNEAGVSKELSASVPFDFVKAAHIWHFTNVFESKASVMRETWLSVAANYAGATLRE